MAKNRHLPASISSQVKFRKPVVPGDTLVMEVEVKKFREKAEPFWINWE